MGSWSIRIKRRITHPPTRLNEWSTQVMLRNSSFFIVQNRGLINILIVNRFIEIKPDFYFNI